MGRFKLTEVRRMLGGSRLSSPFPESYRQWLRMAVFCLGSVAVVAMVSWGRPLLGGPLFWVLWTVWLACAVFYLGRRAWLIRDSRASTVEDIDWRLWSCFQVLALATFVLSWGSGFYFQR